MSIDLSGIESLSECCKASLSDITASYIAAHSSEDSLAFCAASNSVLEVATSKDSASEKVSMPVFESKEGGSGDLREQEA